MKATTIESSPDYAARLVRALKAQEMKEAKGEAISEDVNWLEISREEVREKLAKDSIWDEPPIYRGREFELLRSANLGSNYPTIDDIRIDARTATSMKTLDLSTSAYQNVEVVDSTVRGYIDVLSEFTGFKWNEKEYLKGRDFEDLYLEVGIPKGRATVGQIGKFRALQDYAVTRDVKLVVVQVP